MASEKDKNYSILHAMQAENLHSHGRRQFHKFSGVKCGVCDSADLWFWHTQPPVVLCEATC